MAFLIPFERKAKEIGSNLCHTGGFFIWPLNGLRPRRVEKRRFIRRRRHQHGFLFYWRHRHPLFCSPQSLCQPGGPVFYAGWCDRALSGTLSAFHRDQSCGQLDFVHRIRDQAFVFRHRRRLNIGREPDGDHRLCDSRHDRGPGHRRFG